MSEGSMTPSGVFSAISIYRKEVNDGFQNVYDKLDAHLAKQNAHEKEDAFEIATLKYETATIKERVEEVRAEIKAEAEKARGPGRFGTAGIITAILTGVSALVKALLFSGKAHP